MWDPVAGRGKEFGGGKEALVPWCPGAAFSGENSPPMEFEFGIWWWKSDPGALVRHSLVENSLLLMEFGGRSPGTLVLVRHSLIEKSLPMEFGGGKEALVLWAGDLVLCCSSLWWKIPFL